MPNAHAINIDMKGILISNKGTEIQICKWRKQFSALLLLNALQSTSSESKLASDNSQ